jgi:hypothetical protein
VSDKPDWRETRKRLLEDADDCDRAGESRAGAVARQAADAIKAAYVCALRDAVMVEPERLIQRALDIERGKVEP